MNKRSPAYLNVFSKYDTEKRRCFSRFIWDIRWILFIDNFPKMIKQNSNIFLELIKCDIMHIQNMDWNFKLLIPNLILKF